MPAISTTRHIQVDLCQPVRKTALVMLTERPGSHRLYDREWLGQPSLPIQNRYTHRTPAPVQLRIEWSHAAPGACVFATTIPRRADSMLASYHRAATRHYTQPPGRIDTSPPTGAPQSDRHVSTHTRNSTVL
ncbi:uncharacterized protein B0I36DRAFT_165201 [Microdochium trichocladiopsis]|uniref:Uncharacterized protein n=1 Tax=Microdochium trichocladiopsis TaxID=1682393 RepID=A0A9P8XZK7_9PEZI|nr:uncharacterized protein B0I36DRAFT_165201 [Microdochium trichocladiopsis]KAH7024960.1 hypothetical protein B0I36DRAFT_165201 [Microdochium trichocladiopsis]